MSKAVGPEQLEGSGEETGKYFCLKHEPVSSTWLNDFVFLYSDPHSSGDFLFFLYIPGIK